MTAIAIQPAFPVFSDADGSPLENGYIWIGQANLDPQTNPIAVYWDEALTILAAQPIRTLGGFPSWNGTPARLYAATSYSIRVLDAKGSLVYSAPDENGPLFGGTISSVDVTFLQAGAGAVERTAQAKMRDEVSAFDFMTAAQIADVRAGTALVDVTAPVQAALNAAKTVIFSAGTYLIGTVYLNNAGTVMRGQGKHRTTFKIQSTASLGIARQGYGTRPDGTIATMMIGFELSDFGVDISAMANAGTSKGIAIEDGYDHTLRNIRIIDPLDETSARWGVELGRALYTTSTYDCSIGRLNHAGNVNNSPYNFGTTVTHYKLDSWHVRGRAYQYVSFYMPVIQKDADKFDLDQAISNWTIIGGDFEDSGNFIRVTTAGSVRDVFTAGNSFNGFKGTLFAGAGGRPQTSTFMDEHVAQASRPITSITRAGTTVTVQVDTTLGNGIFKFMAPIAGQFITVSGCGAPFDGYWTVATANAVANSFTYQTVTSGAATGTNGTVIPDWSVGNTYFALGHNNLLYSDAASQLWNRGNQRISGYTLHNISALLRGDEIGSFAPPASTVCYTAQPTINGYYSYIFRNAAGSTVGYIYSDASTTNYATSSDYRLKTNVAPMSGALASVMQLKPCTFQWKDTGRAAEGFIAHELAEVIPSAVVGKKDDVWPDGAMKAQGVDSSHLVARLVAAVQELKREFDAYKAAHP